MGDRRARKAKQARREQRRASRRADPPDSILRDVVRRALTGHPLRLLTIGSMVLHVARPDASSLTSGRGHSDHLDRFLTGLIGAPTRETTALLAVVAELLVDEPERQLRCRRALADRDEHLPRWIHTLSAVNVHRAVRRTHVLGDVDELMIGLRLDSRHELTVAVRIDHNLWFSAVDVAAVPDAIDEVLRQVAETSTDTDVLDIELADARLRIEAALAMPSLAPKTETGPLYRALMQWLMTRLPEGGERRLLTADCESTQQVCDDFFATAPAAPFTDAGHRELLLHLIEGRSGDPLRWSATRVETAIGGSASVDEYLPLEVALDAPDLLSAFITYAHAQKGIRDELTACSLAMIHELRSGYRREVLRRYSFGDLDDAE